MSERQELERFAALLVKWNAAQNLVSRETLHELWPRHIDDSTQLARFLRDGDRRILDLGSGGGFPAIPLAIVSRGTGRHFTLVEPIAKKAAFLRAAARELDLPVTVLALRAEQMDSRETFDLITSRALTALPQLVPMALPFLAADGHMLFHKGRNHREEVEKLRELPGYSQLSVLIHSSESGAGGVLLEITTHPIKSAA
jgi:16S rRNA (guanine527-N7)-methyltransferase